MGIVRGGLFVIVSVLLLLSFLVGNAFLTLDLSLDYENVKPELVSALRDAAKGEINLTEGIEEEFSSMELYCQNNSEFVFFDEISSHTFTIPCEVVAGGFDSVLDYGANSFVEQVYYDNYECDDFLNCVGENPFYLVSQKAKDYWHTKFYLSLAISIILVVLMFLLIEHKTNLPLVVGSLLIISALPFMKLNWGLSFFSDKYILGLFSVFFSKSYSVFLMSLILGIAVLVIGIILKFFAIGFKINEFFSKKDKKVSKSDVKEIVKAEVSKVKEKISKKDKTIKKR